MVEFVKDGVFDVSTFKKFINAVVPFKSYFFRVHNTHDTTVDLKQNVHWIVRPPDTVDSSLSRVLANEGGLRLEIPLSLDPPQKKLQAQQETDDVSPASPSPTAADRPAAAGSPKNTAEATSPTTISQKLYFGFKVKVITGVVSVVVPNTCADGYVFLGDLVLGARESNSETFKYFYDENAKKFDFESFRQFNTTVDDQKVYVFRVKNHINEEVCDVTLRPTAQTEDEDDEQRSVFRASRRSSEVTPAKHAAAWR